MLRIPETRWEHGDDLCDCTFQRIAFWTNPYLGRTLQIRMCCVFEKLKELHPEIAELIRDIPAYDNQHTGEWDVDPQEWNGHFDMPEYLWYRQLSAQTGRPLEEIRCQYQHLNPPKAVSNGSNRRSTNPDDRRTDSGEPYPTASGLRVVRAYPVGGLKRK